MLYNANNITSDIFSLPIVGPALNSFWDIIRLANKLLKESGVIRIESFISE